MPLRLVRQLIFVFAAFGSVVALVGCTRETEELEPVGGTPRPSVEQPSHPLVGQAAPSFAAQRFDGDQVDLAQHRGEVVLLDFWATRCPPCVEGLPKVAEVAKDLEDEGVVFYAVNVGEDAETVEEFLNEQGFDVPVLMDVDGAIAEAYGANAIPQTVLIGEQGNVQAVHVGLSPNVESELRQQLQTLLEGGELARAGG